MYVGPTSSNVLDLTLATGSSNLISGWKVLEGPSFSDHRYIKFKCNFNSNHSHKATAYRNSGTQTVKSLKQ